MRHITMIGMALGALACGCGDKGGVDGGKGGGAPSGEPSPAGGTEDRPGLSDEQLTKFAQSELDGFDRVHATPVAMGTTSVMFNSKAKNDRGVGSQVRVQIGQCVPHLCMPMDKAEWGKKKDALPHTMMFSSATKNDANLLHEIDEMEIDGKKVVTVYLFSHIVTDTGSGKSTSGQHTLNVYYNNGANFAWLQVYPWGGGSLGATPDEYKAQFTRDELVATAKQVMPAVMKQL